MKKTLFNTKNTLFFLLVGFAAIIKADENLATELDPAITLTEITAALQEKETYNQLAEQTSVMADQVKKAGKQGIEKVGDGIFGFVMNVSGHFRGQQPKDQEPEIVYAQKLHEHVANRQKEVASCENKNPLLVGENEEVKFASIKRIFTQAISAVTKERFLYGTIGLSAVCVLSYGIYLAYKKYVCGINLSNEEKTYFVRAGAICSLIIATSSTFLILNK